jgi:hypothetical protein
MSSSYAVIMISRLGQRVSLINCWKLARALVRPKGITNNSNNPYLILNTVFYSSPLAILTRL